MAAAAAQRALAETIDPRPAFVFAWAFTLPSLRG